MRLLKGVCVGLVLLITAPMVAATSASMSYQTQKAKLQHLSHSINSLRSTLSSDQQKKNKLQGELQKIESKIGETAKKLHALKEKLQKTEKKLHQLEAKHRQYKAKLAHQRQLLASQIRSAYVLGRQQYFKILLNQENPARIERYLTYYHSLSKARAQTIKQIQQSIQQVEQTAQAVREQTHKLENAKAEKESVSSQLEDQRYRRQHVLNNVNAHIGDKKQRLQQLIHDKAQLQQVLQKLEKQKYYYAPGKHFSDAKGKLPWPVRHTKVKQKFGQSIDKGRVHSSGILLQANAGTQIHAVYPGKVVFAHWLRGYGLLLIVQHGSVYMTLYAHAQSLYAKVGDSVKSGQVIATVGNSGGLDNPALYFAITSYGKPIDPLKWLRKKA